MNIFSTVTKDNIRLKGFLYPASKEECCVFVPGLAGNPIDNDFVDVLCCKLSQHGYSALCALNRGSFQLYTSTIPGTNEKPKKIGSCSENISDALFDLDAWHSKVLQLGFQNITLIGHCIGCNKIVHYLAKTQNLNCIKRLVFLSPLNMKNWLTTKPYFQDIVKAKSQVYTTHHNVPCIPVVSVLLNKNMNSTIFHHFLLFYQNMLNHIKICKKAQTRILPQYTITGIFFVSCLIFYIDN